MRRVSLLVQQYLANELGQDGRVDRVKSLGKHASEGRVVVTQTGGVREVGLSIECWAKTLPGAWDLSEKVENALYGWQPGGGAVYLQGREEQWSDHDLYGIILDVVIAIAE